MSGENAVAETQDTQVIDDELGTDADFDAGFTGAPTETPGNQAEAAEDKQLGDAAAGVTEDKPAGDGQAASTETPAAEPPAPEFVQLTRDDFTKLMQRAEEVDNLKSTVQQNADKVFGTIGGIQRILNDLKAQPSGQPLQLSEADFAELTAEYPDLAALTTKGLQRVLEKLPTRAAAVDPSAIEKVVQERTATVRTEVIDSHLDAVVDGDWREEVRKPEYAAWIDKQPDEVKALGASDSLRDAAKLMRLYKAHRDAPPPAPAPTTQQTSPTRSRVFAAAVAPKGAGVTAVRPSEDDDFESGFKQGSRSG